MQKRLLVAIMLITAFLGILSVRADNSLDEGIQYLENNEFEKAIDFFSGRIQENRQDDAAHFYLGKSYMITGDLNESIKCFEKAIKLDDKNADYHYYLGAALGTKAQQSSMIKAGFIAPKILKAFEKTVELDSTHINGQAAVANFYAVAPSIMGGDIEKAHHAAEVVSRLDEKRGYLVWAPIYERENEIEKAGECYEKYHQAFADSTDDYTFYNGYGYFLLKHGKIDKAVAMFQRQVELAPDEANPYDSLGDGYRTAGRLEDALTSYEKAVAINPDFDGTKKKIKELKKELQK